MTQLISNINTKSRRAIRKQIVSEYLNKWRHNGIITDQFKQRVSLCHTGLVKDHAGHLVNQPRHPIMSSSQPIIGMHVGILLNIGVHGF